MQENYFKWKISTSTRTILLRPQSWLFCTHKHLLLLLLFKRGKSNRKWFPHQWWNYFRINGVILSDIIVTALFVIVEEHQNCAQSKVQYTVYSLVGFFKHLTLRGEDSIFVTKVFLFFFNRSHLHNHLPDTLQEW